MGFLAFTGDIFVVIFGCGWSNFFLYFSFGNIWFLLYNILGFEFNVFYIFPPNSPLLLFSLISATIVLFKIFIRRVLSRKREHLEWEVPTLTFLVKIVAGLPAILCLTFFFCLVSWLTIFCCFLWGCVILLVECLDEGIEQRVVLF